MKVTSPDRLARLLHDRLAEAGDPGRAVTLARLLDTHLSYATVRAALGMAGKGEYDVALLGLLIDRSLLQVDPAVEAAARRELEGTEPGLGFAPALADRLLRLRRAEDASEPADDDTGAAPTVDRPVEEPVETRAEDPDPIEAEGNEPTYAEAPPRDEESTVTEPAEAEDPASGPHASTVTVPPPEPEADEVAQPDPAPRPCWSCHAGLPDREGLRFCPFCGSDQDIPRCTACGDRLETGWSFCPRCGRALGS